MEEYIKKVFEPIVNLSKTKLLVIAFIVSLAILSITTTVLLGTEKEYVPLFEEKLKISDFYFKRIQVWLSESRFKYKISKTTNEIFVLDTDKSYILSKLSEEKSLSLKEDGPIYLAEQETKYIRNLQEKIEKALKVMETIEEARVYLDLPQMYSNKENRKPSANVILKLKPNSLINENQKKSISVFVSSAVDGLEPDKVKVVDYYLLTDLSEKIVNALKIMKPIEDAIVVFEPQKNAFNTGSEKFSAIVTLKLKPCTLINEDQKKAIRDFVSSAVEGLELDKIEIFEGLGTNKKSN